MRRKSWNLRFEYIHESMGEDGFPNQPRESVESLRGNNISSNLTSISIAIKGSRYQSRCGFLTLGILKAILNITLASFVSRCMHRINIRRRLDHFHNTVSYI